MVVGSNPTFPTKIVCVMESVDITDLKSVEEIHTGSSPVTDTNNKIKVINRWLFNIIKGKEKLIWKKGIRRIKKCFVAFLFLWNKVVEVDAMVVLNLESVRSGIMEIGLNEIAILGIIIAPFIYLAMDHSIRYKRQPNRAERRKK